MWLDVCGLCVVAHVRYCTSTLLVCSVGLRSSKMRIRTACGLSVDSRTQKQLLTYDPLVNSQDVKSLKNDISFSNTICKV